MTGQAPDPWLRRGDLTDVDSLAGDLDGLAEGHAPASGKSETAPLLLVCTHGRRDVCCARLGGPLAGSAAEAAIAACQRGEVLLDRYRGRAGQPQEIQQGDYLAMKASGHRSLAALA